MGEGRGREGEEGRGRDSPDIGNASRKNAQ